MLLLCLSHLQDEEHGSSDGDWQNIKGICCRQVGEPEHTSCLHAGHRQVRHLPQGDEEGHEDWCLGEKER